jgi:hypothetical protein
MYRSSRHPNRATTYGCKSKKRALAFSVQSRAVLFSKDRCERDLGYARQRLRQRTILLRSGRYLLKRVLINSGNVRLEAQTDVVDPKPFALHHQPHAGCRIDGARCEAGGIASKRKRHRKTRGVRRGQQFLGISTATIILETTAVSVGIGFQRVGLGAYLAHTLLAPPFPMYARCFVAHSITMLASVTLFLTVIVAQSRGPRSVLNSRVCILLLQGAQVVAHAHFEVSAQHRRALPDPCSASSCGRPSRRLEEDVLGLEKVFGRRHGVPIDEPLGFAQRFAFERRDTSCQRVDEAVQLRIWQRSVDPTAFLGRHCIEIVTTKDNLKGSRASGERGQTFDGPTARQETGRHLRLTAQLRRVIYNKYAPYFIVQVCLPDRSSCWKDYSDRRSDRLAVRARRMSGRHSPTYLAPNEPEADACEIAPTFFA